MKTSVESKVELSRQGNQEAFAELVSEHQNLICSMTYASCGNLAQSEDLAQETFILAWKNLHKLKDPGAFKSWLCGIARNVLRKTSRSSSAELMPSDRQDLDLTQIPTEDPVPSEHASRMDESGLVWATLEQLPETYRIPLILYYRESFSVERVAASLEISNEAARQRLARGRSLLKKNVSQQVETTLFKTRPSRAFTLAVVSALPAWAGSTVAAAGIGTTSAKSSTWLAGSSLFSWLLFLAGPLLGILGGWFGYKMTLNAAQSEGERKEVKRMAVWLAGLIVSFAVPLITLIYLRVTQRGLSNEWFVILLVILSLAYGGSLFALIIYFNRRLATWKKNTVPQNETIQSFPSKPYEYRTQSTFLGLPWIHVSNGYFRDGKYHRAKAVGWLAFGDTALSPLIAFGSIAIAPVAFGALSVGILSLGGLALGAVAAGGLSLGGIGIGGGAFGYQAVGGLSLGWQAAFGGAAVAHDFAMGGIAIANEANTEAAKAWFESHPFINAIIQTSMQRPWIWYVVGFMPLLVMGLAGMIKGRYISKSDTALKPNQWIVECPQCHHARPLARYGGMRMGAVSYQKRSLGFCRHCRKLVWVVIRFLESEASEDQKE